jgi:hypothetical protein
MNMDVISLSKANKTLNKIKQLDESVVAPLAEDRFPTVDARLDWLEGQAAKIKAENSKQLDLNQGIFTNAELVNGKIQLRKIGTTKTVSNTNILLNNLGKTFTLSHSPSAQAIFYDYRIFDGNESSVGDTSIMNSFPLWVQINLKNPQNIKKMRFLLNGYGKPKEWSVLASEDGINFDQLYYTNNETKVDIWVEVQNVKPYKYIRLDFQSIRTGNRITMNEIEFYNEVVTDSYAAQGAWESPIIDLGEGWKETKLIDIVKQIHIGTTNVSFEIATSTDGISFTSYTPLDLNNLPQGRYIKIRATLSAQAQPREVKTLDFNQSSPENMMTLNEYTEANGKLQLKNTYTYSMTDDGALGAGKQFSVTINKANFKSIKKIEVN